MTVKELSAKLTPGAVVLPDGDREVTGCYIGDLLSWVMGRASAGDAWVTIMSNINIVAVAALCDTACIILAEGVTLEDEVKKVAESKGINVIGSDKTAYEIAGLLTEELT